MKIYFEIHTNYRLKTKCVKNIQIDNPDNIPPHYNSSGIWGFRRTEGLEKELQIDQNWIDVDKYKPYWFSTDQGEFMKIFLRNQKLKSIRNKIYNKKLLSS